MKRRASYRRQVPRRGYQRAFKHPHHWLSASPHVVAIDRRTGTFTVEAGTVRMGPRRTLQDPVMLVLHAPLVELSPAIRRRLTLHQVLSLRVSGPPHAPRRRWTAHYWTSGQLRAVREDAQRLHALLQAGARRSRLSEIDDDEQDDEA